MNESEDDNLKEFIQRCRSDLADALKLQEELAYEKYKKWNGRPESEIARKNYANSERGKFIRSKINFNHRSSLRKFDEDLSWKEKRAIGRFYKSCPEGYEVDHILPISKGGEHRMYNLQYLTKSENIRKGNKTDYVYDKDRVDKKYMKMSEIAKSPKYNLSYDQIQEIICGRAHYGLENAVKIIGKRYFIDEYLFDEWYENKYNN
jgi:5-methylcytosine-specific restriction endonuclease McrA